MEFSEVLASYKTVARSFARSQMPIRWCRWRLELLPPPETDRRQWPVRTAGSWPLHSGLWLCDDENRLDFSVFCQWWCLLNHLSGATSYSSSCYSHFDVGSMYDDIRLHLARSYTSSSDGPFPFISSLTLFQPSSLRSSSLPSRLYFHFHRPPSHVVLLSSHYMPVTLQSPFLDLFWQFPLLSLCLLFFNFFLIPYPRMQIARCVSIYI